MNLPPQMVQLAFGKACTEQAYCLSLCFGCESDGAMSWHLGCKTGLNTAAEAAAPGRQLQNLLKHLCSKALHVFNGPQLSESPSRNSVRCGPHARNGFSGEWTAYTCLRRTGLSVALCWRPPDPLSISVCRTQDFRCHAHIAAVVNVR